MYRTCCFLFAFAFFALAANADDKDKRKGSSKLVGQPAPDFQADFCVNGKTTCLADLKGKVVLVDFWGLN